MFETRPLPSEHPLAKVVSPRAFTFVAKAAVPEMSQFERAVLNSDIWKMRPIPREHPLATLASSHAFMIGIKAAPTAVSEHAKAILNRSDKSEEDKFIAANRKQLDAHFCPRHVESVSTPDLTRGQCRH